MSKNNTSIVSSRGVAHGSKEEALESFNLQRILNMRVQKWYHHITLNFSPEDIIKDDELKDYVQEYFDTLKNKSSLKGVSIDFSDCQYIAVQHRDTKHKHVHILINNVSSI